METEFIATARTHGSNIKSGRIVNVNLVPFIGKKVLVKVKVVKE